MVGKWPQRLVELLNDPAANFLQWRDNGVGGCHVLITDLDAYKAAFRYSSENTAWRQQFTAYMFKTVEKYKKTLLVFYDFSGLHVVWVSIAFSMSYPNCIIATRSMPVYHGL